MTDKIENIEPAFPRDHRHEGHNGMTLRDYFAAQALASISTWIPLDPMGPYFSAHDLKSSEALKARAQWVYKQADAMMIARKGGA